jgi:hypothetical protein
LDRHISGHVTKAIRTLAAKEMCLAEAAAVAEPVLSSMRKLNLRSLRILGEAEAAQDRTTALHAIRECRRNLELIAKLTGELDLCAMGEAAAGPITVVVQYVDKAALVVAESASGPEPPAAAPQLNSGRPDADSGAS